MSSNASILLIDNYDSFTYNVAQYFSELGQSVEVVRNDAVSVAQVDDMNPKYIVISPGPGTPDDAGISIELVKAKAGKTPILGICLGHQVIGQVFGGKIIQADSIMHGKTSQIFHEKSGIFNKIPSPFRATRYHSLVIRPHSHSDEIYPNAWSIGDNDIKTIMSIQHRSFPLYGIQFHPESIMTEHGHRMLKNFLDCRPPQ